MILKTPVRIKNASGLPAAHPGTRPALPPKAGPLSVMFAAGQSLRRESFSDFAPHIWSFGLLCGQQRCCPPLEKGD